MYKVVFALASNVRYLDTDFDSEQEALEALYDRVSNEVYAESDTLSESELDNEIELQMTYYAVLPV